MIKHIKRVDCWGPETWKSASEQSLKDAKDAVNNAQKTGRIDMMFERKGKGNVSYSTMPFTNTEMKYVPSIQLSITLLNIV